MNNLSYWLARIYYRLIGISVNPIPTTFKAEYWTERIFRFIAGLPSGLSGGKPVQFWLELWFYSVTGQSHRLATGTQAAWFWLSKLYAHYAGLPLDGMLVPASDEFWASKLLEVVSGSIPPPVTSPEIRVVANGINTANGDTHNAGSETQGGSLTFQVVAHNDGTGDLIVANPTASGDISVGTFAPGLTITPGNSSAFTVTCDTSVIGTGLTGQLSFANNDSDENPFVINVTFDVTAVPMPEMRVSIDSNIVTDGGSYNLGNTTQGADIVKTVTIENIGSANLTVTSPPVTGGDVTAGAISSTTITPGNSATFTLTANGSLAGGAKSGTVSIANNDSDENPYNWTVNFTILAPEMRISIDGGDIADGGSYAAGTVNANDSLQKTVTIHNDGTADLTVTSPPSVTGDVTAGAISSTTIAPSGSATFTLTCTTSSTGARSGTVSIANNDLDENPYNWTVNFTVRTYLEKSLSIGTPRQLLVGNETSGTTAEDSTAENNDGTYSGVTLNSAASPVAVDNAGLWDGVNDNLNAFSAGFASDFNGQEFTIGCWVKMSGAGVWTDGALRRFLHWQADVNNEITIHKATANNTITFGYTAGGTPKSVSHTISTTNWFRVEMVVSKAGDYMKCFVDGVQIGTTQTGLGTFAGALALARYGSRANGATQFHSGYLYHMRYDTTPLSDADVAKLATVS